MAVMHTDTKAFKDEENNLEILPNGDLNDDNFTYSLQTPEQIPAWKSQVKPFRDKNLSEDTKMSFLSSTTPQR